MKQILVYVIAVFLTGSAIAEIVPDSDRSEVFVDSDTVDLSKLLWKNRVLIVFADSENDPRFVEQMRLLSERPNELFLRDIVVLSDTSPSAETALRDKFHPRGFMLVLIGKDGQMYLRKPLPWDIREITRSVDKLPLRQQEMRDRR
ncbi:DUF4174 domain-containing protein [Lentibacter algarum]|uniref:DUF4174 domain-containing protein n=1 Tax=Lentibacter algarum TaxID=576131 RepID=UPI001C06DA99|nr:DUF4174 domain-containing protein [Lentibacter algarum]MBU2980726.1 DUF4174 domain-containing protein [Lentibacter algarum]